MTMPCPLCLGTSSFALHSWRIAELNTNWQTQYGIAPFSHEHLDQTLSKRRCANCGLLFYDPAISGDSQFYGALGRCSWYYEHDKWEYDTALDMLAKFRPTSVLEIGCGNGAFLSKLSSAVAEAHGIDINENAVAVCRSKQLSAEVTPIEQIERSFDLIVLFEVLEHIPDVRRMLECILQRLNPRGLLLIAVPNPDGCIKQSDQLLLDMPPHHLLGFPLATFEALASIFGLELIDYLKEPLRFTHYQCYLSQLIRRDPRRKGSWKERIVSRVGALAAQVLALSLYASAASKPDGQTHLALFRKPV